MTNVVIDISTLNQTFLSHLVFLDVDKYSVLFFLFLEFHKNVNINLFTILIIFEGTGTAVAEYTICEIIKCFITVTLPYNDRFIIQYNTIQYNKHLVRPSREDQSVYKFKIQMLCNNPFPTYNINKEKLKLRGA